MEPTRRSAVVDDDEHEATLAALVRGMYAEMTWAKARDLVRSGRVKIEGELRFDPAERIKTGIQIDVDPTGPRQPSSATGSSTSITTSSWFASRPDC